MKLKKVLKNKITIGVIGTAIIACTGAGVYLSVKKNPVVDPKLPEIIKDNNTEGENTTPDVQNNLDQKEQNSNSQNTNGQNQAQPTAPASDQTLSDVSLQAQINNADNYSISVRLYGDSGIYAIDKKVGENWVNVLNDANYVGTGGFALDDKIPVSETQRIYRVYRVVEGSKVGPKEITIDRNLVQSNGIVNFPRGL